MFRCYSLYTVVVLAILVGHDVKGIAAEPGDRRWKPIALASVVLGVAALAAFIVVCVAANVGVQCLPTVL